MFLLIIINTSVSGCFCYSCTAVYELNESFVIFFRLNLPEY